MLFDQFLAVIERFEIHCYSQDFLGSHWSFGYQFLDVISIRLFDWQMSNSNVTAFSSEEQSYSTTLERRRRKEENVKFASSSSETSHASSSSPQALISLTIPESPPVINFLERELKMRSLVSFLTLSSTKRKKLPNSLTQTVFCDDLQRSFLATFQFPCILPNKVYLRCPISLPWCVQPKASSWTLVLAKNPDFVQSLHSLGKQ